jgi:hypothetical protein
VPALAYWLTKKTHPGFWHRKRGVAGVPLGGLFNSVSWRSSECYDLGKVAVREDARQQTRKISKSSNLLLSMWTIPVSHSELLKPSPRGLFCQAFGLEVNNSKSMAFWFGGSREQRPD